MLGPRFALLSAVTGPDRSVGRVLKVGRVLLLCTTGILGGLAFPLAVPLGRRHELFASGVLEPLAFICLVPTLIALRGLSWGKAFGGGFVAGMAFFTAAFWWVNIAMTTFGGMPNFASVPALLMLVAWCALHWGLAFGLCAYFEQARGWPMGWTLAPVWMATELLRNYFCSGFPWANLGYSQARNLWFSQVASVFGIYGIAFCVALVNGAVFELWRSLVDRDRERARPRVLLACAGAALVLGHAYGAFRVSTWEGRLRSAPQMRVAVVQGNIDQKIKNVQGSYASMVLGAYVTSSRQADGAGADFIVWPEASFPVAFPKGTRLIPPKALGGDPYRAHLLIGVDLYNPSNPRRDAENAAFLIGPHFSVDRQYTKHHLVPFGEYVLWDLDKILPIENLVPGSYMPGKDLTPMPIRLANGQTIQAGVEICFDAIFPEISRTFARNGANLLVNMTNDAWYGFSSAPFQFLRMVAMRAVETGLPIARAANTGVSAFIDPLGRVLQPTPLGLVNSDERSVDAALKEAPLWRMQSLPILEGRTPYVVMGDVPAYLAVLFCVAGWLLCVVRKGRKASWRSR